MTATTYTFNSRFGLGSVMAIIDDSGKIVQSYEYSASGEELSGGDAVNSFRFVGGYGVQYDNDTHLHYMWNRWYDSQTGRFLSEDPIRQRGDTNLYRYALNRPTTLTDETGLKSGCPKICKGMTRALAGNKATIGQIGGWGVTVAGGTVAVDPAQWGGKGKLRPHLNDIVGRTDIGLGFTKITDVIGGESPIPGTNVRDALKQLYPGKLLLEFIGLPVEWDPGVVGITLTVPDDLDCPEGTTCQNE